MASAHTDLELEGGEEVTLIGRQKRSERAWQIISGILFLVIITMIGLWAGQRNKTDNTSDNNTTPAHGSQLKRYGKEIMVCGQLYYIDTPVVLWTDVGGYDAYRVELRFAPWNVSSWSVSSAANPSLTSPNRYGNRADPNRVNDYGKYPYTSDEFEQVRGGGWDLDLLSKQVDQFVLHYDQEGTARQCYYILQDLRDLSVQFMLDVDGTIYQTLDLKEMAWHATSSNSRSIGIEIANIGAYAVGAADPFDQWYRNGTEEEGGGVKLILPNPSGVRTPNWNGGPARNEIQTGVIQGQNLRQYDLTEEQYVALAKLSAGLVKIFPNLKPNFPRDEDGNVLNKALTSAMLSSYQGILGHYHVQTNKIDPGPAFQWDRLEQDMAEYLK